MITLTPDAPLRPLNTMRVDGTARMLAEWDEPDDLHRFFTDAGYAPARPGAVKAIGEGSNLLFTSGRYDGTLLLSRYDAVEPVAVNRDVMEISAGAGVRLDYLAGFTAAEGLWGLENLSGIPGTTGAAAVQNVGAYGVEFGELVKSVLCYDTTENQFTAFTAGDLRYGYRDSAFKHEGWRDRYVIVSVNITLHKNASPRLDYGNLRERVAPGATPAEVRQAVIDVRRGKLPDVDAIGSAGSFFKNPVVTPAEADDVRRRAASRGIDTTRMPAYATAGGGVKLSAAWLIDRAGWKGVTRGNVATWPSQPLVIVNATGRATGEEVSAFASEIVRSVSDQFGIELHPEVEYIQDDVITSS